MKIIVKNVAVMILIMICSCKLKNEELIYILSNNVNVYSDKYSMKVVKTLNKMDTIFLKSEGLSKSGRINISGESDLTGWIEEKYTSYLPTDWTKKNIAEGLFVYLPSNLDIIFKENNNNKSDDLQELYSEFLDIEIHLYLANNQKEKDFISEKNDTDKSIDTEISKGKSRDYNHSKWILKNFAFYYATTDTGDSSIVEGVDFIRNSNKNKYYVLWVSYRQPTNENNLLLARKIMFSILKSR